MFVGDSQSKSKPASMLKLKLKIMFFLHVIVSVQFYSHPEKKVLWSLLQLQDPSSNKLLPFVFDVVRARVTYNQVCGCFFERKRWYCNYGKSELEQVDGWFWLWCIIKTLVGTDTDPNRRVQKNHRTKSMPLQSWMRVAANERGSLRKSFKS